MRQNYKLPFFHPNHRQRNIILQLSIHYHGPMRSLAYSFFLPTTDLTDGTDECPARGWEQNKNQDKPLGEDGGRCPCCYASALVL